MLQKLLIALCTLFVLTACGGDDGPGDQSRIVLNPPEDLNSGDDDDGDDDEETGPWLSQQFDTDTSASWSFECVSGCDATGTPTHNADDMTLDVTPVWGAADDQIEISTTIDPEIADLTGGNAHLNLYVPSSYTAAGDVNAQVFFVNAADGKGYIGFTTVSAGWNTFSFENIQAGENGSFGFETEAFTLENINAIGVQIDPADGTSLVDVEGTLQIDDVIVSAEAITVDEKPSESVVLEPLAAGDESFTFDSDVQGWSADGSAGSTVSHDADAGAVVITPDWENADEGGNRPKAMGVTTNVVSGATIRMIVTVTQAQIDGGMGVQPYIQQNSGSYSQEFGATVTDLVAGDNAITYNAVELADAMRVGVQLVGPITDGESDVALIKQVEIDLAEGDTEPTTEISVDMTSGWRVNPQSLTMSYTADGVSYQPTAADDQLVFDPAGPLNMGGGSIDFVYEVDQAFIDSGANLQPFFQLKEYASYDYHFCWIGNGDLALGEQTYTCDIPATLANDNAAEIPDGQTAQVGVQTNGGGAGTVTIKSVTIHPAP